MAITFMQHVRITSQLTRAGSLTTSVPRQTGKRSSSPAPRLSGRLVKSAKGQLLKARRAGKSWSRQQHQQATSEQQRALVGNVTVAAPIRSPRSPGALEERPTILRGCADWQSARRPPLCGRAPLGHGGTAEEARAMDADFGIGFHLVAHNQFHPAAQVRQTNAATSWPVRSTAPGADAGHDLDEIYAAASRRHSARQD